MNARPLPLPFLVPAIAAGWAALAFLGFPAPSVDDLFYSGPGLHLAAGQGLVNPWVTMLDPVGSRFLIYPPLYFAILALWVKVCGGGTLSLLLLQAAAATVITAGGLLLLRARRAPGWVAWAWALFLAALLGLSGLRPDLPGIALLVVGIGLEFGSFSGSVRLLGMFLIGASVQTLPALVPWGIGLLLFRFLDLPGDGRSRPAFLLRLAGAGLLNALLFLAVIDFRPAAFFHDFHVHQENHLFGNRHFYGDVWHSPAFAIRIFLLPLLLAAAAALAFRRGWSGAAPATRRRLILAAVAGALAVGLSLAFIVRSVSDIRLLGIASAAGTTLFAWEGCRERRFPWIGGLLLGVAAGTIFVVSYGRGLVEWAQGCTAPPDPAAVAALRDEALALKGEDGILVVDSVSARIAFDFRLPPGTKDWAWLFSWHHPPVGPASEEKPRKLVYLLSPEAAFFRLVPNFDPRFHPPHPIRFLGRTIPRTAGDRNELFLFQVEP